MVNARNAGDGIIFREIYKTPFNGAASFTYQNSYLSNCTQFSLYLDITPTVDATRRVIFSSGELSSNTVFFDIGISTNNKIFFDDGTTETEINAVLTSGVNYKIVVVYLSGGIVLYVNNLITNINFTNTLNSTEIIIGESVDGVGEFYTGYLNDLSLFTKAHNVKEVSVVSGITGLTFLPSTIPGLQVWLDPLNTSDLTMGAAPSLVNGGFDDGSGWTLQPGWTITGGVAVSVNAARCYQTVLTTGNRYSATVESVSYASGTGQILIGWNNTSNFTGTGTKTFESTATSPECGLYGIAYNGSCDNYTIENLSITSIAPRAGALSSAFSQATATKQPWYSSSIYNFATDNISSTAAASNWKFLHDGSGMTVMMVWNPNNTGAIIALGNTSSGANPGIFIGRESSNRLYLGISNGIGGWEVLHTSAINVLAGIGVNQIISVSFKSGTDLLVYVDGVQKASITPAGNPSSSSSSSSLALGDLTAVSGGSWIGTISDCLIFNRFLSEIERKKFENYLASKWSITL